MRLDPISPTAIDNAVSSQLHRKLKERIVACELAPGQRISEIEIASAYEVSRQPVREAFIKLAEDNLVNIQPQRGTYIQCISVAAVLTARFIREAVEADIVRLVVNRATSEIIETLEEQLELQQHAVDSHNPSEFMRLDETFHKLLANYAGTPAVSDYLYELNLPMSRVRNLSAREFSPGKLVTQHSILVDAIRKKNKTAADKALRKHLREIKNDLPQIVQTYPNYFEDIHALDKM